MQNSNRSVQFKGLCVPSMDLEDLIHDNNFESLLWLVFSILLFDFFFCVFILNIRKLEIPKYNVV